MHKTMDGIIAEKCLNQASLQNKIVIRQILSFMIAVRIWRCIARGVSQQAHHRHRNI